MLCGYRNLEVHILQVSVNLFESAGKGTDKTGVHWQQGYVETCVKRYSMVKYNRILAATCQTLHQLEIFNC